ncbi:MAG: glutathione S-transferase family protein [Actinomycetota bacterium]
MPLLLYDNPTSSNALKVRFLLCELGLEYERHIVPYDQPRPDWYVAINSVGGIPTLDDDGFVVSESNAILRYLAVRERRDDLYPEARKDRARVETMLDRWSLTFRPAFFRHEAAALGFVPGKGMGAGEPALEAAAKIADEIAPTLRTLDEIIGASGYALGTFTIADVAAGPVLFRTTKTGLDLAPYPNVMRWRETVIARPAFTAAEPVL